MLNYILWIKRLSPELSISLYKNWYFQSDEVAHESEMFEWFNSKVKRIDEYCFSTVCILFLLTISYVFWVYKHNLLRKSKLQRTSPSVHKRIPTNEVLQTISKSNSNIRKISVTLISYCFTLNKYTFYLVILITYICKKF